MGRAHSFGAESRRYVDMRLRRRGARFSAPGFHRDLAARKGSASRRISHSCRAIAYAGRWRRRAAGARDMAWGAGPYIFFAKRLPRLSTCLNLAANSPPLPDAASGRAAIGWVILRASRWAGLQLRGAVYRAYARRRDGRPAARPSKAMGSDSRFTLSEGESAWVGVAVRGGRPG